MSRFVLHHRHEADECGAVFASFKGHNSPLRHETTLASCRSGGHAIWWTVDAASEADALALLPVLRRRANHRGNRARSRHPMNPSKGATMSQRRAFTPTEIAFLVGIPLAWAVLLLFHPTGGGEAVTYADVQDQVTAWLVVHIGMMLFIPLMAVVVFVLLRGIEGTAARISRIALVPFVVFYGAYEVLLGIGAGILVQDVNRLAGSENAAGAALVDEFTDNVLIRGFSVLSSIGSLAFITADDRGRRCPTPRDRRTTGRPDPARPLGISHHRPPAALRAHRAGPLHRGRSALRAKSRPGASTRSADTALLSSNPACISRRPLRLAPPATCSPQRIAETSQPSRAHLRSRPRKVARCPDSLRTFTAGHASTLVGRS